MHRWPALAAASLLALPLQALAQPQSASAKVKIEAQGDAALDRLKDAVAGQKARADIPAPTLPQPPDIGTQRRAFDAMHSRAPAQAMDIRAHAAFEAGHNGLGAERDAVAKRLGQALGLEAPDTAALAKGAIPAPPHGRVPVLFVSSSMPIATLRTYAEQLEKARGVMAFRGMPGGLAKVAPMAKLSAQILRIYRGCEGPTCAMRGVQIIVDPVVFRLHGVTRVPALAMIPGDPAQPYCERDDESARSAHLVLGDAALSGMFEEFGRLGGREEVRDAQANLEPR